MSISFDEIYLTSQQILERISEREIYEYYLNTNIKGDLVKCCFHKDSTPSLGFYKSSNNLNFKCFGCGAQGGVFQFVSKLHNDCSFGKSLNIIQKTFKLSKNDNYQGVRVSGKDISSTEGVDTGTGEEFEAIAKTRIIPTFRNWQKIDLDYWSQYGITLELLDRYNVRPCNRVHIIKKSGEHLLFAEHHKNNPIYCYKVQDTYKIYRPLNPTKSGKWVQNSGSWNIQGIEELPDTGELLIITSSLKDVMVLNVMGYNAVAPHGEGLAIPEKIMDYLWASFDNIIVFYDNDPIGLEYGENLANTIGAGNIYIPLEYNNTKDISDFVKEYSLEQGIELMKQLV